MKVEKNQENESSVAMSAEAEGHKEDKPTGDLEAAKSEEVDKKENGVNEDDEAPVIPALTSSTTSSGKTKDSGGLLTTSTTKPGAFAISNPLSDDPIIETLQRDQNLGDSVPTASVTQVSTTTNIAAKPISVAIADPMDNSGDDSSKRSNRSNRVAPGHKRRIQIFVAVAISVLAVLVVVLSIVLSRQRVAEDETPFSKRREDMIEFLGALTDSDAFDPSHPYASADRIAALKWIVEEDELQLLIPTNTNLDDPAATKLLERYVVALFYMSTNGEQWENQYNFLSKFDVCRWSSAFGEHNFFEVEGGGLGAPSVNAKGIICDENERVTSVRLWWESLSGTIPEELGFLDLTTVIVSGGSMVGTIPSFFGDLSNLSNLSLNDNCFTGTIPKGLVDHPALSILSLHNNNFAMTGSLEPFCESPTAYREGAVAIVADHGVECSCCILCDPDRFECDDQILNATWSTIHANDIRAYDSRNNVLQFQKDCLAPAQLEWIDEECPCVAEAFNEDGSARLDGVGDAVLICDDCTSEGSRPSNGN